jgi:hypothetical protein
MYFTLAKYSKKKGHHNHKICSTRKASWILQGLNAVANKRQGQVEIIVSCVVHACPDFNNACTIASFKNPASTNFLPQPTPPPQNCHP